MYVDPNFPSKTSLKTAVKLGKTVMVFSPGPFPCQQNGIEYVEGPHYPQPHKWYAKVQVENGKVVKVF